MILVIVPVCGIYFMKEVYKHAEMAEKKKKNYKVMGHTYLMLSVCVLYSMMVLGGRFRTRRSVSLMRAVVAWSLAVLFQMEMMSSWGKRGVHVGICWSWGCMLMCVRQFVCTWKRTDTTAPQISSPTMNCSPSMARIRFSQHRDAKPFLRRMIHFPPILLASSYAQYKLLVSECAFQIKS